MMIVYVVLRHSDTGDTEAIAVFTSPAPAEELSTWIDDNESPAYTSTVEVLGVDTVKKIDTLTGDVAWSMG